MNERGGENITLNTFSCNLFAVSRAAADETLLRHSK